jgi:hypothetical protein
MLGIPYLIIAHMFFCHFREASVRQQSDSTHVEDRECDVLDVGLNFVPHVMIN